MNHAVICEKRYSYVAFQYEGQALLTFLAGGPIERDYTVVLTADERDMIEADHDSAARIVDALMADATLLATRKLQAAIWPSNG